ncbi:MAG: tetratricopeptide repeat protein, partial [Phycisphaerae bacterium]
VIGNAYLSHGGYSAEAEKHFRAALAIRHRLYGDEHPKVAESLHDLAVSIRYRPDDDGQEHMAMLRQALDMRRELLGEEHLDTLTSMCQLAGSLCDRVDPEAEVLYRKVLEGRRRVLGREHPQVAGALAGLGTYLDWTSRPAEALPFVQEALAIRRKRLKKGHPSIASALTTLGGVHAGLGNLDDAERAYREALKIYRKTYTDDHVYLLSTPGHLGRVLLEKGEPEEAEPFLQEALRKIAARAAKAGQSEGNRDEWARCRTQLARHQVFMGACVSRLGRHAEAESFLLDANSIMTDLLADSRAQNQPEVNWPRGLRKVLREARQRLVELYTAWGKPGAAAQWKARLAEQGEEQDRPGTDRVK